MAGDFGQRHVGGGLGDHDMLKLVTRHFKQLGAAYLRYSCDNSSARSLDDQLVNVLNKAEQEKLFIPWQFIFADASVTGLDPSRQGYQSLKNFLQNDSHSQTVEAVVIDEFSRAGRETLEWFRLSFLCKRLRKNVLGATDQFVLNSPMGEMMLHVFAMFSRFFIAQLRDKVSRGMKGAARRNTSVGRPRLGYGLVPALDAQGRPVVGADGRVIRQKAVHPETMKHVLMAAEWFGYRSKSYNAIAKEFNRLQVDGSTGWRPGSIKDMLADPVYIGVDIYNQTRNDYEPETHKRITTRNPRSEWIITRAPQLRAWTDKLWTKVRKRAAAAKQLRRDRQRNVDQQGQNKGGGSVAGERNADAPTTLLSGTLFCECGQELKLVRSGEHAAMGCFHGLYGLHGCTMNTVKANAIVEEVVLSHVSQHVLHAETLAALVDAANKALADESSKPRLDVTPLKAGLRELTRQRDKLVGLLLGEESDQFLQGVKDQIKNLEKRMQEANLRIGQAQRQNQPAPRPLNLCQVTTHLENLREVLNQEPPAAGIALRSLTGKIVVGHRRCQGKKGGAWTLTFTPTLLAALTERAGQTQAPEAATLNHLRAEKSVQMPTVTLVAEKRQSVHERLAPQVAQLRGQIDPKTKKPYTIPCIAKMLGYSKDVTYLAWRTARRVGSREAGSPGSSRPPSTNAGQAA